MRLLKVKNFSCIDDATLELGTVTVIIGPQASGKSLLSKLNYFFLSLIGEQYSFIEDQQKFDVFVDHIEKKFLDWFPSSAWGKDQFCIDFTAGDITVNLKRRPRTKGKNSDRVRITFSEFFKNHFEELTQAYGQSIQKRTNRPFQYIWQMRQKSERTLSKALGRDYVESQLFIPAGRAFFTSIGKAVVAFEQTSV